MLKVFALVSLAAAVNAFAPVVTNLKVRWYILVHYRHHQLQESFGFTFAEDTYKNQPDFLKGEQEYKQFVNKLSDDNMLNRKYNVVGRVRELGLLGATADVGILSKLEANGIDLVKLEELLPTIEKLGLLEFAGSNQQFLVNLVAPLLIEPAPILLPGVAALLAAGPSGFFTAAAAVGGLEVVLIASNAELPLVGLPAGPVAGLLLVPVTVILGGVVCVLVQCEEGVIVVLETQSPTATG